MGCPDWPKCFGHLIPPTSEDQVVWAPDRFFEEGTMTIYQDTLWHSSFSGQTDTVFNRDRWVPYLTHDYSKFVIKHTWIEYLNRLSGALSGIPALLLVLLAFLKRKTNKTTLILSIIALLGLGFEAWLGKKVVDGNLIPGQISIHMIGALVICGLYAYIYSINSESARRSSSKGMLWFWVGLLLAQILIGIQVRESVDTAIHAHGFADADSIQNSAYFLIHRSIIWVWFLSVGLFWWKAPKPGRRIAILLLIWLIMEGLIGWVMSTTGLPHFSQPLHLLLAFIAFCFLIYHIGRKSIY